MKQQNKICLSLSIKNISKNYDKIKALKNVSFDAYKGEIIALLGPNGAGKSTLMNIISGYLSSSDGDVFVNGNKVSTDDSKTKKDIGFLSEGAPMYSDMTVELFLKYMIELKLIFCESDNLSKQEIKKIYNEEFEKIVETAKIESVLKQKIETLSKGYLRRVGFAQSIIGDPSILLLDEPTDGLDPNQKDHMRKLIKEMGKNKTIVISTHLLEEAENIASRIILIDKGVLVADGDLKEILTKTKTKSLEKAFRLLTN